MRLFSPPHSPSVSLSLSLSPFLPYERARTKNENGSFVAVAPIPMRRKGMAQQWDFLRHTQGGTCLAYDRLSTHSCHVGPTATPHVRIILLMFMHMSFRSENYTCKLYANFSLRKLQRLFVKVGPAKRQLHT